MTDGDAWAQAWGAWIPLRDVLRFAEEQGADRRAAASAIRPALETYNLLHEVAVGWSDVAPPMAPRSAPWLGRGGWSNDRRIIVVGEGWRNVDWTAGTIAGFEIRLHRTHVLRVLTEAGCIGAAAVVPEKGKSPYSDNALAGWFLFRVKTWPPGEPPPIEEDDLEAAAAQFDTVPRDRFREIRRQKTPDSWRKPGPRRAKV